jgi:hypothetical protein
MFEENIGSKLDRYVGDSIKDVTRELRRTKLSLSKRYWRSLLKARGDRDESTIADSDVCWVSECCWLRIFFYERNFGWGAKFARSARYAQYSYVLMNREATCCVCTTSRLPEFYKSEMFTGCEMTIEWLRHPIRTLLEVAEIQETFRCFKVSQILAIIHCGGVVRSFKKSSAGLYP